MREFLQGIKGMTILEPSVTIRSALKEESRAQLAVLADAIAASLHS